MSSALDALEVCSTQGAECSPLFGRHFPADWLSIAMAGVRAIDS
jgi:hypothetical protein